MVQQINIQLEPYERGFHLITDDILGKLPVLPQQGLFHLFIKHTSAALTISENYDPLVRSDYNKFFNDLVPDSWPGFEHTLEGPDDMAAHIKMSMMDSGITIPITDGKLNFGRWQGIYLCEFRNEGGARKLIASIYS